MSSFSTGLRSRAAPPLTRELARRIEREIVAGYLSDLAGPHSTHEEARRHVDWVGETALVLAPDRPWQRFVYCFGAADLSRIDEIIGRFPEPPPFHLTPTGFSTEVAAALSARSYRATDFFQALLYGAPDADAPVPEAPITVEEVTTATAREFAAVSADAFEWDPAWRENAMNGLAGKIGRAGFHPLLARIDGAAAGAGSLTVRDGVGSLGGGCVRHAYRRRGIQLALLRARMRLAAQLGCDLVTGAAAMGSESLRNQHRAGLQIATIECTWRPGD
jgi:hypothetical protein